MKISGKDAFDNATGNLHRAMHKWYAGASTYPKISHTPKFKLPASGNFFTIGSCFARNVENALVKSGISVISNVPVIPGEYYEIGGQPRTGYQNVYTPGSTLEALKLFKTNRPYHSIVTGTERSIDLLTSGTVPLKTEVVYGIRDGILQTYNRLPEADALIITLGYNESWTYLPDMSYINRAPANIISRRNIDQYEFCSLDYNACHQVLQESVKLIKKISPNCKIILTVSPVPLSNTFTNQHIVLANQLSKSILRSVASSISSEFNCVDYFPSYEIIMNSERSKTFMEDGIHVMTAPVDNVIEQFKEAYF